MKKILLIVILFLLVLPLYFLHAQEQTKVEIYYNEACAMCAQYVKDDLPGFLNDLGFCDIKYLDHVNEEQNRTLMNDRMKALNIPCELQSHIMTFVRYHLVIGGHVAQS